MHMSTTTPQDTRENADRLNRGRMFATPFETETGQGVARARGLPMGETDAALPSAAKPG